MFQNAVPDPPRMSLEHALAILEAGIEEAIEFDIRSQDINEALNYLSNRLTRPYGCTLYAKALDLPEPYMRYEALCQALKLIRKESWVLL